MLVSHLVITYFAVRENPGLTIDELAEKIYQKHGRTGAARYLCEDQEWLRDRIADVTAVAERDGRFYCDSAARPYTNLEVADMSIEMTLQKQIQRNLQRKLDGD